MAADDVERAVEAIHAGQPVLLPTDTVYGLCVTPYRAAPAERLYRLKGREERQPIALVAASHELLFECVPELRGRSGIIARTLLPGPYTLVFQNPARRYRWLTGDRPDTIGVRVPDLPEPARRVLEAVACVAATSANASGGADPATLSAVPEDVREACAVAVDAGELPGTPSTVIDFTARTPVVVREGAAPSADALDRVREALGR